MELSVEAGGLELVAVDETGDVDDLLPRDRIPREKNIKLAWHERGKRLKEEERRGEQKQT